MMMIIFSVADKKYSKLEIDRKYLDNLAAKSSVAYLCSGLVEDPILSAFRLAHLANRLPDLDRVFKVQRVISNVIID